MSADRVVEGLLRDKLAGTDCDENGSAEVKAYFDRHSMDEATAHALALAFPLEADEWHADRQAGLRDVGRSLA